MAGGLRSLLHRPSHAPAPKRCFARRKEKHRTVGFQQEFVAFLHKYGIEYDPEHIWTYPLLEQDAPRGVNAANQPQHLGRHVNDG